MNFLLKMHAFSSGTCVACASTHPRLRLPRRLASTRFFQEESSCIFKETIESYPCCFAIAMDSFGFWVYVHSGLVWVFSGAARSPASYLRQLQPVLDHICLHNLQIAPDSGSIVPSQFDFRVNSWHMLAVRSRYSAPLDDPNTVLTP